MKVGDLVKFARYLRDVSPIGSTPVIGLITALCGDGECVRIEVLWPSGELNKMRATLFEAAV